MHQTRKELQWYFGMKTNIGVEGRAGLAQSAVVTVTNVHVKEPLPVQLHGDARRVYGERVYASQKALTGSNAMRSFATLSLANIRLARARAVSTPTRCTAGMLLSPKKRDGRTACFGRQSVCLAV